MSRARVKKGVGRARSLFERKILVKSPEPENKAQRKDKKEMTENYLLRIMSGNYRLRIIT
jgi:hypothetical protein